MSVNNERKRLDIGCGNNKTQGSTYLDVDKDAHLDILPDLNEFPYRLFYSYFLLSNLFRPIPLKTLILFISASLLIFLDISFFSNIFVLLYYFFKRH